MECIGASASITRNIAPKSAKIWQRILCFRHSLCVHPIGPVCRFRSCVCNVGTIQYTALYNPGRLFSFYVLDQLSLPCCMSRLTFAVQVLFWRRLRWRIIAYVWRPFVRPSICMSARLLVRWSIPFLSVRRTETQHPSVTLTRGK